MREFISGRFIKVTFCALIISFGAFAYNFMSSVTLPTTNIIGSSLVFVQDGFSNVSKFFSNAFSKSFEFDQIIEENSILKSQISSLEEKLRDAEFALIENEGLRSILNIKDQNNNYDMCIAEVVGKNLTSNQHILTLDVGIRHDISVNDLVITSSGVVGYISEVGENYSKVRTVLDPKFTIGCIVSRSRVLGILENSLEYTSDGFLKLGYIDKNADVLITDTVETSGVSGLFPKGLLIGTVNSIKVESQGVSKYATLNPAVDFDNLNQVYVIRGF